MFFLFPGVWHTYRPFANTGWKEYWIGFKGEVIDRIVGEGFFVNQAPVFNIGLNERIVDLYIKAFDIANEERSGFQQALGGIVMHLLGLMYYRHRTRDFVDENMINKMNKAKVIMREGVYENLSAKEVADRLHIGYSGFRKAFKEFTGTSPAQYMQELKLNLVQSEVRESGIFFDVLQTADFDDARRVPQHREPGEGRGGAHAGIIRVLKD